jgi:hypothetical protein
METFQKTGTHKAANDMVAAILPDRHSAEMAMISLRKAGLLSVELATKNGEVIEELGSGLGGFVGGISRFFSNRGIETMEIYKALLELGVNLEQARYLEERFPEGGELIVLRTPNRSEEAITILKRFNADLGLLLLMNPIQKIVELQEHPPEIEATL